MAKSFLLAQFPNLRLLTGTTFVAVETDASRVKQVVLTRDGQEFRVRSHVVIDATADGNVCVAAGGDYRVGEDAQADFHEPHAPVHPQRRVNAIDLIYCVQHEGKPLPFQLPEDAGAEFRKTPGHVYECPPGLRFVNTCGMLPGIRWLDGDRADLIAEARRKVWAHFDYLRKTDPYYRNCRLMGTAPQMGVRETRRIVCEYMLTENDVLAGWDDQPHGDMIAMSDHPLDVHGEGHLHQWLAKPYGVPFRCLIPLGWENLLVAGRGAGFSHIAASSCRLSRTMMALGEAAGLAGSIMAGKNLSAREVPISELTEKLIIDDRTDFMPAT